MKGRRKGNEEKWKKWKARTELIKGKSKEEIP
jgi:hypothetical protein